ncbi:MAG: Rpp14/Pop5 family protein [Candidatus Altiarchaeota archaeon]
MAARYPPTLRERNRYLVLKVESSVRLNEKDVLHALLNATQRLLGEVQAATTSLWLIEWDENKNIGILKTNHKTVDPVRASIVTITEINKTPVLPHIIGVSGTIKKARQKWIK